MSEKIQILKNILLFCMYEIQNRQNKSLVLKYKKKKKLPLGRKCLIL